MAEEPDFGFVDGLFWLSARFGRTAPLLPLGFLVDDFNDSTIDFGLVTLNVPSCQVSTGRAIPP